MSQKIINHMTRRITNHLTRTIQETVLAFLTDRKSSQLSPRTIEFYNLELGFFEEYAEMEGIVTVEDVNPDFIRKHLLELAEHRNPGGVHARFRAVRAWLNWTWDEYEIDTRNPISRVKPPRVSNDPLPGVSIENIVKMVAACRFSRSGVRDTAIFLCLLDTACRRSEFLSLEWDDLNLVTGDVHIRNGKGNKSRTAHLGKRASKALRAWQKIAPDSVLVWTTQAGSPLSAHGLREIVRRRALDAGIDPPGLHDFRRAALLAMLRNGADAITVSRYAGHADVRVTLRYLAQTDEDIREAHIRTSPVDNFK